ncbi:MAG TPA: phosphate acyltransferase PlsX [Chitinophagaceae bacterium]|nr:phosphate acyltransferase PlsX [Chitinophagaceae bacterium]MCB0739702.1 phosphate acyltransferase PlsX [Chitinophagaceae bacterium]HQV07132.1 phosphate acyltransferase PlsX [Chitinophagaceae bacterium]
MIIGIDMMGGDLAPLEAVKGVQQYLLSENTKAELQLIGDAPQLEKLLSDFPVPQNKITLLHAAEEIGMHEHPTRALKEKKQSGIALGFAHLAAGKTDAFISAGNSGAMLVGAAHIIQPIAGVLRPTIPSIMPQTNGQTGLLLDVGLNVDCKPEHLHQFGIMGAMYAQYILGIEQPKVGLINIGEESSKGNQLTKMAFELLQKDKQLHFIGNIEGRDLLTGKTDVMVCDGFTGNILLKFAESLFGISQHEASESRYFQKFNFENYGGTPVLGIRQPVIMGHGISGALAFKNMICLAENIIQKKLLGEMKLQMA